MKNIEELKKVVGRFESARILVMGDIMLDQFIIGSVSRISPEAPVPVVEFESETFKLGGAANAINNIMALGGKVIATGVIGADASGRKLIDLLEQSGVNTEGIITIKNRPTTIKTRIIAEHQQVVRIDREKRDDITPESTHQILDFVNSTINDIDAILIPDYDKGVVTNMLLGGVIPLAKKFGKPVVVHPKIAHFLDYNGVTIVNSNLERASMVSGISQINETSIRNIGQWLLTQLESEYVLLTRGKEGMTLFEKSGDVTHVAAIAKEVYNVTGVGAGDTVASVVALCLAVGAEMVDAATIANTAAGIVVGKLGTATATKEELKHQLDVLKGVQLAFVGSK